jgi:hypothetical protein
MNKKDEKFIAQVYSKLEEIDRFVSESGYNDRVMSSFVFGLIDDEYDEEDENVEVKTFFMYNLTDQSELEAIKDVMDSLYNRNSDLDDLLGELGIRTN